MQLLYIAFCLYKLSLRSVVLCYRKTATTLVAEDVNNMTTASAISVPKPLAEGDQLSGFNVLKFAVQLMVGMTKQRPKDYQHFWRVKH